MKFSREMRTNRGDRIGAKGASDSGCNLGKGKKKR